MAERNTESGAGEADYFALIFRLLMAWTFLFAGLGQVFSGKFSAAGLLGNTKTFHGFFALFAGEGTVSAVTFLVSWGHLLIGISLLIGLLVRVSASIGVVLMILYWMAQMDWPYIANPTNFIVDFHIVYAVVLAYLEARRAGHVHGLDGWAAALPGVARRPGLKWLLS